MQKLEHQLCFEVYKAANQFTKLYAKTLAPFGLTYPQYLVLLALSEEDQRTTSSLCEKLCLGIGTLNPVLQKLVEKNWVKKTPSSKDKRAAYFSLTPFAKEAYPKIEQAIINKLFCSDFLLSEGPALKEHVHQLNDFLARMNKGEM
ncbi:MarR family winged helix-turn-helix transcriptional regulator [Lysinibacillus sp. LZ02]|uniref:MarR family winged helix-turn-helix transcriptional regulator n=1 Tax=Lysinibacillus sp. LZ02 TaxID=3420668 RepID=UPI003D35B8B8